MKFQRTARALAGVALVAGGLMATPALKAHAGSACITDPAGDSLNPYVSQSDLLADPDPALSYADISGSGICVNNPGATIATVKGTVEEASFTIPVAGGIPSFPQPGLNSEAPIVGETFQACVDVTGPLGNGPVQIGTGHRGGPVFDGPYPASQGWKYCTYATIQAATPLDWGVEIFDPVGNFTFFDESTLKDTSNNPTITAPGGTGTGSPAVTLYLPETLVYQVDAVAPPLKGLPHNYVEPFLAPIGGTGTVHNAVVETQVQVEATLPFPVCVNTNPAGVGCNGNQIVGPIQGIAGLLFTVDFAPGVLECTNFPVPTSCSNSPAPSGQASGDDFGLLPLPPFAQSIETCANPLSPGPPTPPANNGLVTCTAVAGTYSYNPCQTTSTPDGQDQGDLTIVTGSCPVNTGNVTLPFEYDSEYGRIVPYQLPKVDGFTIGPSFLPDGWNA